MKCNRCGSENPDGATFCATCGAQLSPNVTVSAPLGQNGPIVSGNLGPNGPTASLSVPIKNKKVTAILVAIIAIMICGGVAAALLLGGGKEIAYACTKSGKGYTSSIAETFKRNAVKKIEYTLILEDDLVSDGSHSYSYSGSGNITSVTTYDDSVTATVYNSEDDDDYSYSFGSSYGNSGSSANSEELMEVLGLSLMIASFEQYAKDPGVTYYENERESLATYAVTLDIDKLSSSTKAEIIDDDELKATPEEFQKQLTTQGYICSKK